jgi:hypothetical protein
MMGVAAILMGQYFRSKAGIAQMQYEAAAAQAKALAQETRARADYERDGLIIDAEYEVIERRILLPAPKAE